MKEVEVVNTCPECRSEHLVRDYERAEIVCEACGLVLDDFIIDETIWFGHVVDGRPFKLNGMSGKARLRLLHVFKLRDGVITKENVWFDYDELRSELV